MSGYSSKPLRDIDRDGIPLPAKPGATDQGRYVCQHDRDGHYHGKSDHYGVGYHGCLVWRCDCTSFKNEESGT